MDEPTRKRPPEQACVSASGASGDRPLASREVVVCGRLVSMTRREAAGLIEACGGRCCERVSRKTSLVVVGSGGLPLGRDGRLSIHLMRARRLAAEGCSIEVLSEDELLELVGLARQAAGVRSRFTAGQVADMLGVSRARLDGWIGASLVRPVEDRAGIALFDFRQVAAARTLADLAAARISISRLRDSLAQLARWLPDVAWPDLPLEQDGRRLIVRTPAGKAAELSGQLLLEFDELEERVNQPAISLDRSESREEIFRRAMELEDLGQPAEAAEVYRRLLVEHGPEANGVFSYGNALYAAGDVAAACQQFRRATILDPQFAEGWNNYANVLAELERLGEAVAAYRRALAIAPQYADAHFNLAETLVEMGRADEAVIHWTAYLAFDSDSGWAEYARQTRQACQHGGP